MSEDCYTASSYYCVDFICILRDLRLEKSQKEKRISFQLLELDLLKRLCNTRRDVEKLFLFIHSYITFFNTLVAPDTLLHSFLNIKYTKASPINHPSQSSLEAHASLDRGIQVHRFISACPHFTTVPFLTQR